MVRRRVGICRRVVRGDMMIVAVVVVVAFVGELRMVGEGKVGRMFVLICGMWISLAVSLAIEEWSRSRNSGWRFFAAMMVRRRTRRCERSS